jgi:hypothetical protein
MRSTPTERSTTQPRRGRASLVAAVAALAQFGLAVPEQQPPAPAPAEIQLVQAVDTDLRLIDKGRLAREEREQCDEAKSLAQRARRMLDAKGGDEPEARSLAMAASRQVAPLVRRQLKLDTLMAAAALRRAVVHGGRGTPSAGSRPDAGHAPRRGCGASLPR